MEGAAWFSRWNEGRIGFHLAAPNPWLTRFAGQHLPPPGSTIFVPLCGKTVDMVWLAERGHQVSGAELVESAVQAFFSEWGREPGVTQTGYGSVWRADNVTIHCADLFDLPPAVLTDTGMIWDRAALVALPAALRKRYAATLAAIVAAAPACSGQLLLTMDYDQSQMSGPPFAVSDEEVQGLYSTDFAVQLLETRDVLAENEKFRERGLNALSESLYLLTPR